uniref:Uncharacterized protein n=2 Tax=unclassified Caudoviricetes TaxID=2788787 RepID=A0A8S5SBJ5_9CAUD|nr:MAG TPA: hypothetical protein [Siphoviridae sp. ctHhH6]DAF48296.1 MAG TPA: hypothetical protein [Siphoviridae sp. ct4Z13]DAK81657.1 MAG TPA: hypothetical protein [Caudoviricetes sp.]DAY83064.1 MAG TPA: hypothetical protein [Caudoviricetes sp.]DAY94565.1 MAG TPA: hypothetical protein [Caudoviricetes sp.]
MKLSARGLATIIVIGCFIANCLAILVRSI